MLNFGVSVKLKDFEPFFFLGWFKVNDERDVKKAASIACKRYGEDYKEKYNTEFLQRMQTVEIYERKENKIILKIDL